MVTGAWPWERLAQSNAPSHELLVELLAPSPGERWLDVATGSGGVALRAARAGADVTGIDIAPEAVEQARERAAEEGLAVRVEVGDAQALPYEDASFDVVASAYGVNFAADHRRAAAEVARVCRPGGRLGLTLMPPGSRAAEMWTLLRRFDGNEGDHPAGWAERLDELLGDPFALDVRRVEAPPEPSIPAAEAWECFRDSFGPLKSLLARLDAAGQTELRREFLALRERFDGKPRSYVLVLGRRR